MAQTVFRDMVGLRKGLQDVTIEALNRTIEECYIELKNIIDEDVYKKAKHESKEPFYERTYDMARAFVIKYAEKKGLGISAIASIKFDDNAISHNSALLQHASNQDLDGTVFFGILNNDVPQGDAIGGVKVKRKPFFDDWLDWMDKNYSDIYKRNLFIAQRKAGIRPKA